MAVTITQGQAAVAIRAATDADAVPAPVQTTLGFLMPAATAIILQYAPSAPDDVHNAALIRLLGWLFEADPTDSRISRAIQVSGAAPLLSQWRVHRAGLVEGQSAPGTVIPPGAGLPPEPPDAATVDYILAYKGGQLVWQRFPLTPPRS